MAHRFLREHDIAANLDFPPDLGFEELVSMVEAGACGQLYGLWELESRAFLGLAGLHRQGRRPGWCRILYALVPMARGHGFAHEAAAKLLEVAFHWTEAEGVTAAIHKDNAPSRAVALRLGMKRLTDLDLPGLEIYGQTYGEWRLGQDKGARAS